MLSQDEVAEAVGTSGFSVYRWEHGDNPVGIRSGAARKLHEVLGVPPGSLMTAEEPGPLAQAPGPGLQLEVMYLASAEHRRAALEAATAEDRERYAATIKRVVNDVWSSLSDWEAVAADTTKTAREREVARGQLARIWQHLSRLAILRVEVVGGEEELPQEELAGFVRSHASVLGA